MEQSTSQPSILETDEELANQQEVLAGNEVDDAAVKRKNLFYSLVIVHIFFTSPPANRT